ncbi:MAG: phage tail protein [Thermomicrobiales bacterium]
MGTPFLSEIRIMSFNFPPKGWAFCNGQLLPINQNQALFSLLGTTYGGNGQFTFALPNLQGKVPMHMGNGHILGASAGEVSHTLTTSEMPTHLHTASGSSGDGTQSSPTPNPTITTLASAAIQMYAAPNNLTSLNPATIATVGGSQPHLNQQPYLTLSFCIALQGIFPSRT